MKKILRTAWITGAAACAWIMIATFSQAAFTQRAPVKLLFWSTRSWPLYLFVGGAFVAGLAIGGLPAIYYGIRLRLTIREKESAIARLTERVAALEHPRNDNGDQTS
jgi:uncharacterized integral membrane protein